MNHELKKKELNGLARLSPRTNLKWVELVKYDMRAKQVGPFNPFISRARPGPFDTLLACIPYNKILSSLLFSFFVFYLYACIFLWKRVACSYWIRRGAREKPRPPLFCSLYFFFFFLFYLLIYFFFWSWEGNIGEGRRG